MSNCNNCQLYEEQGFCGRINNNGIKERCPTDCFLPYDEDYFLNNPGFTENLKSDVTTDEAQNFINNHSDPINIKATYKDEKFKQVDNDSETNLTYNCGDTSYYLQKCEGDNVCNDFPELPDKDALYAFLSDDTQSDIYRGPIKWDKVKDTNSLRVIISDQDFSKLSGLIDNDGVELEWLDRLDSKLTLSDVEDRLLMDESEETRGKSDKELYETTVNKFFSTFNEILGLSNKYNNIKDKTRVPIEAREKRYARRYFSDSEQIQQTTYDPLFITPKKIIDIFMITKDDVTDVRIEENLNALLDTNELDAQFVTRIGNYTNLDELGKNSADVLYIERKIIKFLSTNTDDFVTIFKSANLQFSQFCINGFSERPMNILGKILQLRTQENTDDELEEEKVVIRKIFKYIPSIMKKILDISEKLELSICDQISRKTQLYREIYKDLFVENNVMKFDLPDLGILDFFADFSRNIYTKILLLIFIGFVITQIVSLLKVNVNMSN